MADNIQDKLGDMSEKILTASNPPIVPRGNEEPVESRVTPLENEGSFEGDLYYSKTRPKGDEVLYVDDNTYDFLNNIYGGFDQSNEQTLKAQKFLTDIGYYDGELDGFYGNKTKGAIKRYLQNRNDINSVWAAMQDQGDLMQAAMDPAGAMNPQTGTNKEKMV